MDQELDWWVRIGLDGWRTRSGPHYQRIAGAIADAIARRLVDTQDRLPAERALADALGVSRGTVVRCFDELVAEGLVERRQGAGTFVRGRPAWTHTPRESAVSTLLRRQLDQHTDTIDLSLSVPANTDHLPDLGPVDSLADLGHGLHPAGTPELRAALAEHLTHRLHLPTTPDQLIVTSGAQHALTLVAAAVVAPGRTIITGCPGYPGLAGSLAGRGGRLLGVPVDGLGVDPQAVARAAAHLPAPVLYLDPPAHNPTGAVLSAPRRAALLNTAQRHDALVVEDLALAGLWLAPEEDVPPLASMAEGVIAVGSLAKMFWAGLRIGWIRAPASLRGHLIRLRSAHDLAPSVPAQAVATALLHAVDDEWFGQLRAALRDRRELLVSLLRQQLPAWPVESPRAGLSLWPVLPVADSETYAHRAAGYGVLVAPGAAHCVDGRHRAGIRLSFAEAPDTLAAAVDRLAAAWEEHSQELAASRFTNGR